jgi:hypothetical protein
MLTAGEVGPIAGYYRKQRGIYAEGPWGIGPRVSDAKGRAD